MYFNVASNFYDFLELLRKFHVEIFLSSIRLLSNCPNGVGSQVRKNKINFLSSNKISEIQRKKYLALYNSLQSDWLTQSVQRFLKMIFSISPSQLCSHTPSALNAGAKRSGAMPQCCYLAKGAKRPSHTTNMKVFFSDLCNPNLFSDLCNPNLFSDL